MVLTIAVLLGCHQTDSASVWVELVGRNCIFNTGSAHQG